MKKQVLAILIGAMGLSVSAQAAVIAYNTNVGAWTVGSGQSNGAFTTATETQTIGNDSAPLELGLRAQLRTSGAIAPVGGNSNVYIVPTGTGGSQNQPRALWNVDFSTYAPIGGVSSSQLATFIAAGHPGISLNLRLDMNDGAPTETRNIDLLSPTGYGLNTPSYFLLPNSTQQANSENLRFGYLFGNTFDSNAEHWVYARLTAQVGDNPAFSVDACFHTVGASASCEGRVPVPGTIALLCLGLLGLRARHPKITA